ncbi:MAG: chemotaxis protein MotB [Petroclostridium sp.]|jgi:chemotaxis protein MotB|uniref:OmpA/MotB family protein n=1 Tax=Petroclostridium xylanilyticum TaxID=1792311 RepID=UPI000B995747|nr:OmpA family protein [Petroclostridium xylanilyticum]MBZ4645868.1 OmpA/MotB domain protein [Clostridia bacterium]MDK2809332.1 chemotaxis protein MotB [Petroclostridium sp.]
MSRRRNSEEVKKGAPEWMNTYGDMVTLLLTFFIMLFAMSTIDVQKFEQIIHSIQGSLGVNYGGTSVSKDKLATEGQEDYPDLQDFVKNINSPGGMSEVLKEAQDMEKIYFQVKAYIDKNNLGDSVEITRDKPGLLIRFKDNVLFDSGKADLKEDSKKILKYIAGMLNEFTQDIRVEGHTDNVPIHTPQFPSNWELSTQRAVNVLKYFIEENGFNPVRLSAVGYGEYHPVADNSTEAGRRQNRRVDIVILKTYVADEISSEKGDNKANEQR